MGKGNRNRAAANRNPVKTVKKEKSIGVIVTAVICAVALLATIAVAVVLKSDAYLGSKTAVDIGNKKVSALEYRYQYWQTIQNWYTQNYYYIIYGLYNIDFSKSLSGQTCSIDKDLTWAEYFQNETLTSLKRIHSLDIDAQANGFTLSDEAKADVDKDLEELRAYAKENYGSLSKYLRSVYRTAEKDFLGYNDVRAYVTAYYDSLKDKYVFSQEAIQSYYDEHKTDYDDLDYRYYVFSYEPEKSASSDTETKVDEAKKAEMKTSADNMAAAVKDSEGFADYIVNNLLAEDKVEDYDRDSSLVENIKYTNVQGAYNEDVANWLSSSERNVGDVAVFDIESKNCYLVIMFLDRSLDTYKMINVRHILIKTPTVDKIYTTEEPTEVDTDATKAAQEKSDAEKRAKAEEILAEFNSGAKTEEAFGELANKYSEDTGSNTTGGLYENVYKGMTYTEFNDWCFDPARKAGDVDIVKTDVGYHIMYFVSEGEPYWSYIIGNKLQSDAITEYVDGVVEKTPTMVHDDIIAKAVK